jgi:ketosteroid isomerase-like protein
MSSWWNITIDETIVRRTEASMSAGGDPIAVAVRFNEAINARDLTRLGELVTEDHRFIDSEASVTVGSEAIVRAWRWLLSPFPDYRNDFEALQYRDELVIITGRSSCSDDRLRGPALWTARVREGHVAEWRVYEDNTEARHDTDRPSHRAMLTAVYRKPT